MTDPDYYQGYFTGIPGSSFSSGLGAAQRQQDDEAQRKAQEEAGRSKNGTKPRPRRFPTSPQEQQEADEINRRIAISRRRVRIVQAIGAAVIIAGAANIYKITHSAGPNGTIYGATFPAPITNNAPEHAEKVPENQIPGDISKEAVRGCDKPAAQAMETPMNCFGILPYERLVLTIDPDVPNEYRATQYDWNKKVIWKGYVSKDSFYKDVYSPTVAPGVPRVIRRARLMEGAEIKVAVAFGKFHPFINNKAPSEQSVQPNNRSVNVSRDSFEVRGSKVELYNCDGSFGLCEAGIQTPGGAVYGVIRQQDLKNLRVGYYGDVTGPQNPSRERPATNSRPTPRL